MMNVPFLFEIPARRARSVALAATCAILAGSYALAQDEPKTTPPSPQPPPGSVTPINPHSELVIAGQVAVGELAPDFELDSSLGRPVRLSSLRGDWVLLVFAERKESLRALADTLGDLHTIGVRLVGVCDEKPRTIESFAAKQHASFLLLADVTGEVSALYGVWDRIHTMSVPGFVLIDRHGRVHIALLGQVLPAADLARLVREVSGQL